MTRWTSEQERAITERGHNLIVSAAAGSGKTAVLTQRVVEYITNGGDIDRLLVVTFTNAAAAEMRERIAKNLAEECRKNKQNKHLRRQRIKLARAQISTIDAYFAALVRRNFEKLNISPRFGTVDGAEQVYIVDSCLEEILEDRYGRSPKGFSALLDILGGDGENEYVAAAVKQVYDYIQTIPFCDKWLLNRLSLYNTSSFWTDKACDFYKPLFAEAVEVFAEILGSGELNEKESVSVEADLQLARLLLHSCEKHDYESLFNLCSSSVFVRQAPSKSDEYSWKKYKIYRKEFKALVTSSPLFSISPDELSDQLAELMTGVEELVNIVLELQEAVTAEFTRQNKYSFGEIAKMAFSLLVENIDEITKSVKITPYAEEIREGFDEILIDEYQDVNDLQDMFFYAISKDNMFVVGDVKQSIYAFRRANPENFINKKKAFTLIDLNKNFRSRGGILGFTNFICAALFSVDVGGLDYEGKELLVQGSELYEKSEEPDIEAAFIISDDKAVEQQAQYTADRIKQLIGEKYQVAQKDGTTRNIELSDFAVLLSVLRDGTGDTFRNVLLENGIPAYIGAGSSFLQSAEVNTIISLLKTLQNPYNDTSLFITMQSPLYGFSDNEIAEIRLLITRKKRLYAAVEEAAKTNGKAAVFVQDLSRLKMLASNLPLSRFIWQIYSEKDYLAYASSLEMGDVRYENMLVFLDFVRRYETDFASGTLSGLISFIDYSISKNKLPEGEAAPQGSYVTIMSIHKSKGLEFPVCIMPRLEKGLANSNNKNPPKILLDEKLGIGTKIRDKALTYEQNTFMFELIKATQKRTERAEILRKLYVALTRARQKLILISAVSQTKVSSLQEFSFCEQNGKTMKLFVEKKASYCDLLLTALSHHPTAAKSLDGVGKIIKSDADVAISFITPQKNALKTTVQKAACIAAIDKAEILRRFAFEYAPNLTHIPAKITVTELAKGYTPDEDSVPLINEKNDLTPAFIKNKGNLTGANAGTAYHRFFALANLQNTVADEKKRLFDAGAFTQEELDAVSEKSIDDFLKSDLYSEILQAISVMKEKEFVVEIDASAYDKTVKTERKILLQGAIDLLCAYDDGFVIADYKSDRKTEQELIDTYKKQLYLYKYAVEKQFGKPVKKVYIWSIKLSKKIEVKL